MKKIIGITAALLIIMLFFPKIKCDEKPDISRCLALSGADFVKMEVEGSTKINTEDSIERVAEKLINAAGFDKSYKMQHSDGAVIANASNDTTSAQVLCRNLNDENIIYVSLTLSHYKDNRNINNNIRRTISNAFLIYNAEASFSSLIQGRYGKCKNREERKKAAEKIFSYFDGKIDGGIEDGNLTSMSGYTPYINDSIEYMNKKVNLNIALRYSVSEGCTYIWIGSPLILREY